MTYRKPAVFDLTDCLVILAVVCLLLLLGTGSIIFQKSQQVTAERALDRFEELADSDTVEIIRHSNNRIIIGEPRDVTFELLVDGKPMSGRCQDSWFEPMICRLYGAGGE